MMNEKLILSLVEPYLVDSKMSYEDFDKVFSMLELHEQYGVARLLNKNGIELVDSDELKKENADILNEDILDTPVLDSFSEEIPDDIIQRKNIKQSNEILCSLIQRGNRQAENDLCVKNHGLVYKYANRYLGVYGHDLTFDDLLQAGYSGLLKASKKFDTSLGYAFTTYAVNWIMQSITRELVDHGFTIRVPVHMVERINKMIKVENALYELGYDPVHDISRVALEMDCSVEQIRNYREVRENYLRMASLNTFIGEGNDTELSEIVVDNEAPLVEDICVQHDCERLIKKILKTLTRS